MSSDMCSDAPWLNGPPSAGAWTRGMCAESPAIAWSGRSRSRQRGSSGRFRLNGRHHIDDPRSTVVLVSYQAPRTLGAQLLEKRPTVRFHGRTWNKWAEVVEMSGFSGHAGHDGFLALLGPAAADTGRVCLVHGEPPQAEALAGALREHGFADVAVPQREETVGLA